MGTVMGWVDKKGVRHQTLVLDASYRNALPWGSSAIAISLPYHNSISSYSLTANSTLSSSYISIASSTDDPNVYFGTSLTDRQINTTSGYFEDNNSGNYNTTVTMRYSQCNTTAYMAGWCRSKKVTHHGRVYNCDHPNIQTLIRINCSAFTLDGLDPTPNGNRFLITKKRRGSGSNVAIGNTTELTSSSQGYNSSGQCHLSAPTMVYTDGKPTNNEAVTPVLELELLE